MPLPRRILTSITKGYGNISNGGSNTNIVEVTNGTLYSFFIASITYDASYSKSIDGGLSWDSPTSLRIGAGFQVTVCYDRWSGIDSDLIHITYSDTGTDDVYYRNMDTANMDSLSAEYTVFAGVSTAAGATLSIAKMRGGNLLIVGSIDSGTEILSKKSTDNGINWTNISPGQEAGGAADISIIMPGWGADSQDAMLFYYDRSALEISVKYYDDSADTWNEVLIATGIVWPDQTTSNVFGNMSTSIDLTNNQNILVFWTALDLVNAKLQCFKITQTLQTETLNQIIAASADDEALCTLTISPLNHWYVFYLSSIETSEGYATSLSTFYKVSTDQGASWSNELVFENPINRFICYSLYTSPVHYRILGLCMVAYNNLILYSAPLNLPRSTFILGI